MKKGMILAIAVAMTVGLAHAGTTVTGSGFTGISAETDLINSDTLIAAVNFTTAGGTGPTVNGITFANSSDTSALYVNGGTKQITDSTTYWSGAAATDGLEAFDAIFDGRANSDGNAGGRTIGLSLTGLTIGQQYRIQLLSGDAAQKHTTSLWNDVSPNSKTEKLINQQPIGATTADLGGIFAVEFTTDDGNAYFTLERSGPDNQPVLGAYVLQAVTVLTPSIAQFTASSTNVFSGDTITLSWSAFNADTLTLNPGAVDVSTTNNSDVVVTADTTYQLIAENTNGSVTSSVPVTVITTVPVINSFAASRTNVIAGSTVTLSWQVDNATGLSIDQGVGDVTGSSTQIVVNADTTYVLTATNVNGSVNSAPVQITAKNLGQGIFSSDFDGNTGAVILPIVSGNAADGVSGSPTLGITDWTTDASVTSISGLTAISPGGTFCTITNASGVYADLASPNTVFINHNLNISDRENPRGYSLTFTTDSAWNLGWLIVRAGHANGSGGPQAYASDLTVVLEGGTLGAPVTQTIRADYNPPVTYIDSPFDLTGTTIGAGTYTLSVTINNMPGGGAYASFDGIQLAASVLKTAANLSIDGPVSGGNEMVISWMGDSGSTYRVETNSNLIIESGWNTFESGISGTGGEMTITNAIGPNQTFYRVITE